MKLDGKEGCLGDKKDVTVMMITGDAVDAVIDATDRMITCGDEREIS